MAELAVMQQTNYRQAFEQFIDAPARQREPAFLRERREQAWQRYQALGFPTPRIENWRFTDLTELASRELRLAPEAPAAGSGPVDIGALALPEPLTDDSLRLVFINGQLNTGLSRLDGELPAGCFVGSMSDALASEAKSLTAVIEAELDRSRAQDPLPFAALNTAFMNLDGGAFIYVANGQAIEQPIELIYCSVGENTVSYPRVLSVLGEAAQAQIVESHHSQSATTSFPLTELRLGNGSRCQYHKLQQESGDAYHLGTLRIAQARDSHCQSHLATLAGKLNRTDIYAALNGANAHCGLSGLVLLGNDGEFGDYHVTMEHAHAHATSDQTFKNVLDGKSRAVFDGVIKVVPQAQKTDARQNSRSLLLSKQAKAQSNPRLEILADDVKCAHGSTIGFLDPDALFYLRSRGLSKNDARAMLVYAFANEQINAIALAPLRERLEHNLAERFRV